MNPSVAFVTLALFLFTACSSTPPEQPVEKRPVEVQQAPTPQKDSWSWDYEADSPRGPERWSKLNPQYDMCATGTQQSPINLVWHKPSSPNPLDISYRETNATLMNTGYTIRLEMTPQSQVNFKGTDYILEKIEMRTPSEHSLSGNRLPMELQFYHRSTNGLKQAMISLFVITGRGSAWFDRLWDKAKVLNGYKSSPTFKFNPLQLIPPRQTYYHYQGSLTHPPCLEGVQWFVFNTPLQLSKEQIAMVRGLFKSNNRPIQPTNDRPITNY